MNVQRVLDAIEELAKEFGEKPRREKLQTYSIIRVLVDDIRAYAEMSEKSGHPIPNVELYLIELMNHIRCLARISEPCGDDNQEYVWVLGVLNKLRSSHCFNLDW